MNAMRRLSIVLAATLLLVPAAALRADTITPAFTGSAFGGGLFTWNYQANFVGVGFQLQPGSFFTIFDFGSYVPGSCVAPTGWNCAVGSTIQPGPGLNGPATDLTFTYDGGIVLGGAFPGVTFTGFSAQSTNNIMTQQEYVSQDALLNGQPSPLVAIGPIFVPQQVPEPSTLLLLGTGLVIAAFRRRPSA